MKHTVKTLLKSGVCLILVLCMVLGFVPATALTAQAADEKPLVYVSIGDSMTNGYCLEGYDGESGAVNYAMASYANQFAVYLADYKGIIEDDQVIFEGDKRTVDHRQLALSGMRAEDVQWILELDYTNDALIQSVYAGHYDVRGADGWNPGKWFGTGSSDWGFTSGDYLTWANFVDYNYRYADAAAKILQIYNTGNNGQYFKSSYADQTAINNAINGLKRDTYYPEGTEQPNEIGGYKYLQIATEFYQESMKDADIISLAVGNTNFGTHMLYQIVEVVMGDSHAFMSQYDLEKAWEMAEEDEYTYEVVTGLINSKAYEEILEYCLLLDDKDGNRAERIEYIVEHCMVSYITSYIAMVRDIVAMNPDVQIIIMGLMNAYETDNVKVTDPTLGELVAAMYVPVNKILKNLARDMQKEYEDAQFSYASAPHVSCMVDVFGDDYYTKNNNTVKYPGLLNGTEGYTANLNSIVRDRFVEEIVFGDMMFAMLGIDLRGIYTVETFEAAVAAYELMTPVERAAFIADGNADIAKTYALYLAFENGLIRSGTEDITLHSLACLADIGNLFMSSMPDIFANIRATSKYFYSDVAAFMQVASNGAITADQMKAMLDGLETAKTAIWNSDSVKPYHATLAQAGHSTIEHVIECETCMDGGVHEGMNNQLNALLIGIAAEYKNQLDLIPYEAIATMMTDMTGGMLNGSDFRTLCRAENYENAVYEVIAGKSDGQLTADQVAVLATSTEDDTYAGVWIVAGAIAEMEASTVKDLYNSGLMASMAPDKKEQIDTLISVSDSVRTLLASKDAIQGDAAEGAESIAGALDNAINLAYLLGLPKGMSDAMYNSTDLRGAMAMNARILLGTGAGGHPSEAGHAALFKSIKDAKPITNATPGDVNGDDTVTSADLNTLRQYLANYDYDTNTSSVQVGAGADYNGDGKIDSNDLNALRQYFANYDYED